MFGKIIHLSSLPRVQANLPKGHELFAVLPMASVASLVFVIDLFNQGFHLANHCRELQAVRYYFSRTKAVFEGIAITFWRTG